MRPAIESGLEAGLAMPTQAGATSYSVGTDSDSPGVTSEVQPARPGSQAVIGAGSFVNRDVPDLTVAVVSPCRVIGGVVVSDDGSV